MALAGFKVIDADGHVTEPATLYKTHIDPKFRAGSDDLMWLITDWVRSDDPRRAGQARTSLSSSIALSFS